MMRAPLSRVALVLCALWPLANVAQPLTPEAQARLTLPSDPVAVWVVTPDSLETIAPESISLGSTVLKRDYRPTARVKTTVQGPNVTFSSTFVGTDASGAEIAVELFVTAQPEAFPEVEDLGRRVAVGAFTGWYYSDARFRALTVEVARGRQLSVTTMADLSRDDLVAFVEALDMDRFAALPEEEVVWRSPESGWIAYETLAEYWQEHPATFATRQATVATVVSALPLAPAGLTRTPKGLTLTDAAYRGQTREGEWVGAPTGTVLPVVQAEACYTEGVGPSGLETAALLLSDRYGETASPAPVVACLTLRALPPDEAAVDRLLREIVRSYVASGAAPEAVDEDAEVAGLRARAVFPDGTPRGARAQLGGLDGYKTTQEAYNGGAETTWLFRLDSLRTLQLTHPVGREAEAAALLQKVNRRALAADLGESVVYAVRPSARDPYDSYTPAALDTSFVHAGRYSHTPMRGLIGSRDGMAEIQEAGMILEVPVPDGWALWNRPSPPPGYYSTGGCAFNLAASPEAAVDPCEVISVLNAEGIVVVVGPNQGTRGLLAQELSASDYDRPTAYLLSSTLPLVESEGYRVDPPRPLAIEGAFAAVRYGIETDRFSLRVIQMEHETLGSYAVAVASPPDEAEQAEALLMRTARGLRATRIPAP